jgi:sec-independent protein translocase protein TatA
MIGDLFDSPWKILIIAIVVLVLFGSRKMPDAARALGRSMRILKAEVREMHEEDPNASQDGQQGQGQWQPAPPQQIETPGAVPAPGVQFSAPPAAAPAPSVPYTPAAGFPASAPAAPPASVPVPEVQQDTTRPA